MTTILRVKRKKHDEPLDALLVSCKRQKVENDESSTLDPLTAIIKFAGTVEKQDDGVIEHITKTLRKDALKTNYKQHVVDISKKVRDQTKLQSHENRYKIISNMRSLDTSLVEDLDEDVIHIIDIEDTKTIPDEKSDIDYVYDLYCAQLKETLHVDNLVSVLPIQEDLVFEDYYKDNEDECLGESEDSNSESNWKNDYPDSDHSDESVENNDIREAMKNLNVDDELSSDSDDFVYGLDEEDVERYGHKYAKYKAQMKKEKEEYDSINANSDKDDDDYYIGSESHESTESGEYNDCLE